MFVHETGNWKDYRKLEGLVEFDLHRGRRTGEQEYWEAMAEVRRDALDALRRAQADGALWLMFTHGRSTSGAFATTSRSQVRGLMRSPDSTPYVIKRQSIQHYSVFVARIRPLAEA